MGRAQPTIIHFLSWYILSVHCISSIYLHMPQSPEGGIYQLGKFSSIYLVFSLTLFLPLFFGPRGIVWNMTDYRLPQCHCCGKLGYMDKYTIYLFSVWFEFNQTLTPLCKYVCRQIMFWPTKTHVLCLHNHRCWQIS